MECTRNLAYVTYELYPINQGGCGVLIWNSILLFLKQENIKITVLIDAPSAEIKRFNKDILPTIYNNNNLSVLCLDDLLINSNLKLTHKDFDNIYLWKSYLFFEGLNILNKKCNFQLIEFFDYVGIGYFTIRAKKYQNLFKNTTLAVRAHCTIDILDQEQVQNDLSQQKIIMYQMERQAIFDCDILFVPSPSWADIYNQRYGIEKSRILVSPPPIPENSEFQYDFENSTENILFYGRLFQLKGVDVFVDAAILYLINNRDKNTNFYLVGYDDTKYLGNSYKEFLISKIPEEFKNRFIFTGHLKKSDFNKVLQNIKLAVFPNFIESFCYSIHELYNSGVPIIIRPIPAFCDYFFDEENCLYFDGSSSDLANKIEKLLFDKDLQKKFRNYPKNINSSLFYESYHKILETKIIEKTPQNNNFISKLSIILINHNENSIEKSKKTWAFNDVTFIDKNCSYVLWERSHEEGLCPVFFLGKIYYITDLDGKKPKEEYFNISQYFWIGDFEDKFPKKFFNKVYEILKNNPDLKYISSYSKNIKNNDKANCIQHDLLSENPYAFYEGMTRIVFKNIQNKKLRELFDFRLNSFGENQYLQGEGYTIPSPLQKLSIRNVDIGSERNEHHRYFLHQSGKNILANPYPLMPLARKEPFIDHLRKEKSVFANLLEWINNKLCRERTN